MHPPPSLPACHPNPRTGGRTLWLLWLTLAAWLLWPTAAQAAPAPGGILVLYSYGDGGRGIEQFRDEFRRVLSDAGVGTSEFFFEYLDLERTADDPGYRPRLRELLLRKYRQRPIAVVVTVQQPAFHFLLHEMSGLAPAAPAIAVQAAAPHDGDAGKRRIVAQLARFDIRGTLERALELFPGTRHITLVAGDSEADRALAAEAAGIGAGLRANLAIDTTSDQPLELMLQRISRLPPHSIVLFTQYNRDVRGQVTLAYEVERQVIKAANAPVFGLYDFNLVNGGIGGSVLNVRALGDNTARLALALRDGRRVLDQPVTRIDNPAQPIFNWTEIERWHGATGRLPAHSQFVNRPPTLRDDWEDHKQVIVASLAVFSALALTIAGLVVARRKQRVVERLLTESEADHALRLAQALEHKRQYETGLELLLQLNQQAGRMSEREICDRALDIAVRVTHSRIGDLHLVNADQNSLSLVSWNAAALTACTAVNDSHYPLAAAGIWADCARQRRPVIHNDYPTAAGARGCPEGHAEIARHLSVPVLDGEQVRMIIGVGNKSAAYTEEDSQQLQMVANEVQKIVMKRRAEEALRESEARFRFIADLSPGLVWVADTDQRCIWLNATWLAFTGLPLAAQLDDGRIDQIHPADRDAAMAAYRTHFARRESFSIEYRLRRHDGVYRWMLDVGQPRYDEQRVFKGYVGTCLDITDQRDAEAQLRKLWLGVEQSPDSIVITDAEGTIEYVNRAFCMISGYAADDVLGGNPRLLQSGNTPPERYREMWAAIKNGDVWEGEFINRRKNGELYIEFARISPVRESDGTITHFLAIKQDITERKRTEDAVRASRTLLQSVIDSTPDWIHVKDRQHRFMLVNRVFASAFGRRPEEMIGGRDTDFLPADMCAGDPERGIPGLHDDDDAIFAGRTVHRPHDVVRFDNGTTRVFDTIRVPLLDAGGRIYGSLTYRRDITERHAHEQEQRVLEGQLRQAQKMELIGHLAGGIAHDFNNILAAMFGYAELAQMMPAVRDDPRLDTYIREILQAGIRAKELVAQLLTFCQRRDVASEAIAAAPIVREVARLLRSTMPATISIVTDLPDHLPEVLISAVELHQVLMNLGVNARDAIGGQGRIDMRVAAVDLTHLEACDSCHVHFSGEQLMICVRDTGSGIAPGVLPRIFDPFFTTKEVGRGSGLGLSVLHGIVHSAQGHIVVRSTEGAGSEFRIYLPAHRQAAPRRAAGGRPLPAASSLRGHVLVVDDEVSIVGALTHLLEQQGCTVTGSTRAGDALRRFQQDPYAVDMVITDQTMPDVTGAELARAMLAIRPDLPVVLCTGYSNVIDEDSARRIGIRRFLMKPVPARILADVVRDCLAPGAAP